MTNEQIENAIKRGDARALAAEVMRLQDALHKAYRDSQSDTQKAYLQGVTFMRDKAIEAIRGILPNN
jgi:hypothetical protein